MATLMQRFRQVRIGRTRREPQALQTLSSDRFQQAVPPPIDIAPNDPIVAYFLSAPGAVELDKLNLNSPALRALKEAGVQVAIPLVSQGELVGLLNLGPRLSEQDYSTDDRGLLNTLATQAAPAVRVAQLVREQRLQARERERIEQELHVARLIQQTLLPKELPALPGWQLSRYYQPARAVGGDFYDFLYFKDGRLGIVIGDVTDKGVPAALVMATTRSILRAAAQEEVSPGQVLERTNDLLCPDIPPKMFVTCLYAILYPASGLLRYANAGHDLPYLRQSGHVSQLRATGMPLGLMPGMGYEEKEITLSHGDSILFYSDGIVEAHDRKRNMFGFPRLVSLLAEKVESTGLIDFLLRELAAFTGPDWEQEDDVTLVTLQRSEGFGFSEVVTRSPMQADPIVNDDSPSGTGVRAQGSSPMQADPIVNDDWQVLGEWTLPSERGNERIALQQVAETVRDLNLSNSRLERLKTAVAEATMNAMEHGNHYQPDKPVSIQVLTKKDVLAVRITDHGGNQPIPQPEMPDLEAKLAELQTPRGWGLFLIKNLVDDMHVTSDETHHTLELIMHLEGEKHGTQNS